ncbi:electron transport complex subunit E [Parasulfuritortus cantonensis]|uniref:Ion-translocating oxidoreductase complex subunit E n=1 Tax=Parasulfuritortus cantonensis TaxID=2528202 RepID=A0A4R1BKZ7_9PROT|nr:electron transport complex subunit E [Parasulfuritortus cantonensis]TCJ18024.1 electron transport complex subunit E [Parasulfuritortus cantonensis]
MSPEAREIIANGLWKQNPGIVQLLGLCPLLAISSNVVNALSLGLATTLVMAVASGAVAVVRGYIPHAARIPLFVLIIAALVTVVELLMHAYVLALYVVLGVFLPLITTNCIVLARVEAFASKRSTLHSVLDAVMMGLGLTLVLVVLGAMREIAGKGTLLSGLDLAFGPVAKDWVIHVIPNYQGLLLAILPPGAFIGLGLLIAARNWVMDIQARRANAGGPLGQTV